MDAHMLKVISHRNRDPLYFIILPRVHKMLLFAYVSYSLIAPHTCSSHIHFNNTLRTFIYTYAFIVIIFTITKIEEC